MAKNPTIEVSTYSKPANLPGFPMGVMRPQSFSPRYKVGLPEVRHMTKSSDCVNKPHLHGPNGRCDH
jgi:hypothetical protein